jgi:hypothetical protein
MKMSRKLRVFSGCVAIVLGLMTAGPVEAGAAQQAVRREILRRVEVAAAERAAVRAAEQQAARQAAAKAAQQQAAKQAAAKAAEQQAARQVALRAALIRDARRDAATKVVPLSAERRVWRYTSKREAAQELKAGVPAGAHMTSKSGPGRPPSGATAQRQYGLPKAPEVRMKIRLDRNTPVKHNKALGGEPGRGEVTSTQAVGNEQIERITPLH